MLQVNPAVMVKIATDNGWLHIRGRREGSINAAAMADGVGVATTTILRAYDGGLAGATLVERLKKVSGLSFDELLRVVPDEHGRTAA